MSKEALRDKIKHFTNLLPRMSKDDINRTVEVMEWDADTRFAFMVAKNLYDKRNN